jgi:DNA polymerase I-like protein with 3'-5' exonuclease and polymerase domains
MPLIYLDIETEDSESYNGLDVFNGRIVTVQMLLPSGKTIIIKDPSSLDNVKSVLENNLIVGHNIKFDAKFLKQKFGITLRNVYDTQIAEIIISGGLYAGKKDVVRLQDLVFRYFGKHMDKAEQRGFLYGIPLTMAQKEYASNDLRYLPEIFKQQQAKIKALGLEDIVNIEMKAIPAIVWLELSGISVDLNKLEELRQKVQERKDAAEAQIYEMLGTRDINLNSTQQLKPALNNIGIPVENTKKEELAKYNHPVLYQLQEYKDTEKLLNTFIEKIPGFVQPATGRIHADYFQIGAVTGRFSCKNPNMQQQPSKKLHEWKEIFVSGEGNDIVTADYSQIELRILAQLSGDEEYLRAYKEGTDLHKLTASKIFNKPLDQVTSDERSVAKTVNFGIAYGMWIPSLQMKLKPYGIEISEDEAKNIIEGFYKAYPKVKRYLQNVSSKGLYQLSVTTMAGRLIKFERPADKKERGGVKRQCKNFPIQGLCADMVKIAIGNIFLRLEPIGVKFIATVHDEVVFECRKDQTPYVKQVVKEEMEKAGSLFITDLLCISEVFSNSFWHKD